jgi:alginate O-acetyltransferase complex protein AlgI
VLQWILYILVFLLEVGTFATVRSRSVRQRTLLAGSYLLYATWGVWFAAVLLASTGINYLLGAWIRRKPAWTALWSGILLNLALLGSFKYLPEAAITLPWPALEKFAHLALPLGISFWTFQALSYLFDLYRGEDLNPTLVEFALYMAFFPVTISGPVCRVPEMLPQFRSEEALRWGDLHIGFRRIATGFLMMQLAKLLGHGILGGDGITSGFDRLHHWTGPDTWCLAFGFGLQLFFDFAGYSHMAIGAAKVLGFRLPENFARPFGSTSPSVFWTRWHVSLSFWIRDYVFLTLAMLRRDMWWRNLVLVISMILFGLWHKASLLFILWGAYHGILLVLHRGIQQLQRGFNWEPPMPLWDLLAWAGTIGFVSLGWIFFRANSLKQAGQMFSAVASPGDYSSRYVSGSLYFLVLAMAAGYLLVVLVADWLEKHTPEPVETGAPRGVVAGIAQSRWIWIPPLYVLALAAILMVNATEGASAALFMYRGY